jgi:hypothetical protein
MLAPGQSVILFVLLALLGLTNPGVAFPTTAFGRAHPYDLMSASTPRSAMSPCMPSQVKGDAAPRVRCNQTLLACVVSAGAADLDIPVARKDREAPVSDSLVLPTKLIAVKGAGTTLFRAVGPNELPSIQAAGRYGLAPGGAEGKYFFATERQASNFAKMMGDKAHTTTSVNVSPAELLRGESINPFGEGPGYFFRGADLPAGPVNIFNYMVLP